MKCALASINAAHPRSVITDKVKIDDGLLEIDDISYYLDDYKNIYVTGGGNVAGHVAAELENLLGNKITEGVVVTDDIVETERINVVEGNYPLPGEKSMLGTQKVLNLANSVEEDDLVLGIISGGGSPLLTAPVPETTLADIQKITKELFTYGVSDRHVNVIRKHLSAIKGGQLARAVAPASLVTILFSDVISQRQTAVASGPTLPDNSTYSDAINILNRHEVEPPERIRNFLKRGQNGAHPETPTSDDEIFERVSCHTLATGRTALEGARKKAESLGYNTHIITSRLRGDAQEIAKAFVASGEDCYFSGVPIETPVVLLANGQTSTPSFGSEELGQNQTFALSAALEFHESLNQSAALASIGTDGIDGYSKYGGAIVDSQSVTNLHEAWKVVGTDKTSEFLAKNGDLLEGTTTGTNVNDIHVLVIDDN
ncbi:glycerate kinase type-2 family protein [Haloarcula amylovorans]|uniref:glycerate kinase type-2 family protein n=1 Tax=Haloarcula amylovorans TaxID=2562280 RepID=UPI00142F9E67|nr:DUF4147 domain-containing protein [Halomicroarcula amylolytica]